ncbi:MAG: ABC transporter permease, partial [Acidimicrobiales bacterium]
LPSASRTSAPTMTSVADPVRTDDLPVVATGVGAATIEMAGPAEARRRPRWVTAATYVATVFALLTVNFALPRIMPGDPIDALMAFGSPNYVTDYETRANLAAYYDLDEPVLVQYAHYLGGLVKADLGVSIVSNVPVSEELVPRLGWSALLIATSIVLAMLIGLPLGVHSGWKRSQPVDRRLLTFFLSVQNLPIFFVGAVALVALSAQLGIFPLGGATTPFNDYSGLRAGLDVAHHLALPALLMGLDFATYEYLVMRSSMVGELGSDYLLAGRAKGLRERRLKYRYAGRNALLPVVTVVGLQLSMAVTGIIFVERVFAYPGLGSYMYEAVGTRDYPAMQGAFLVLTLTVVTINFLVDLLYRRLDPRTSP